MIAWCQRSGRETFAALLVLVGLLIALAHLGGCAAFAKAEPYLPTPAQIACAELEADKGTPVLSIIAQCGFAQDAFEVVAALVAGHRRAGEFRAAHTPIAPVCDAGADAK